VVRQLINVLRLLLSTVGHVAGGCALWLPPHVPPIAEESGESDSRLRESAERGARGAAPCIMKFLS
jgi:hypothetical protein